MRAWPATLPQFPERGGLTRQPSGGIVYGATDAGAGKTRPESTAKEEPLDVPMIFTGDQKAGFWRFWNEVIGKGRAPFWFPAVDLNGWALGDDSGAAVTDETGAPILFQDAWFVMFRADAEPPVFTPRSGLEWSARLPLWILLP